RFDRRFRALLGGTRKDLIEQIDSGFPFLPAGCHMELDPVAADIVLRNIRSAVPSRWKEKVEALLMTASGGRGVSLATYLESAGLELEDVYSGNRSWSDLRADAGLTVLDAGPQEGALRRALGRLLHIDDAARINGYRQLLAAATTP